MGFNPNRFGVKPQLPAAPMQQGTQPAGASGKAAQVWSPMNFERQFNQLIKKPTAPGQPQVSTQGPRPGASGTVDLQDLSNFRKAPSESQAAMARGAGTPNVQPPPPMAPVDEEVVIEEEAPAEATTPRGTGAVMQGDRTAYADVPEPVNNQAPPSVTEAAGFDAESPFMTRAKARHYYPEGATPEQKRQMEDRQLVKEYWDSWNSKQRHGQEIDTADEWAAGRDEWVEGGRMPGDSVRGGTTGSEDFDPGSYDRWMEETGYTGNPEDYDAMIEGRDARTAEEEANRLPQTADEIDRMLLDELEATREGKTAKARREGLLRRVAAATDAQQAGYMATGGGMQARGRQADIAAKALEEDVDMALQDKRREIMTERQRRLHDLELKDADKTSAGENAYLDGGGKWWMSDDQLKEVWSANHDGDAPTGEELSQMKDMRRSDPSREGGEMPTLGAQRLAMSKMHNRAQSSGPGAGNTTQKPPAQDFVGYSVRWADHDPGSANPEMRTGIKLTKYIAPNDKNDFYGDVQGAGQFKYCDDEKCGDTRNMPPSVYQKLTNAMYNGDEVTIEQFEAWMKGED